MFSDNDTIANHSLSTNTRLIPIAVKFWIYLLFLIPSFVCSLFVLYYLLYHRTLRVALHNHAIIIFLVISVLTEITLYPWKLYLYNHEGVWERSDFFCTIWVFIDWGLYYTQTILFAWAAIERHILIFHQHWLTTEHKRFFIHYLPLILVIAYCFIYYTAVMFYPSCKNQFDSYYTICVELCSFRSNILYIYDAIAHQILPNVIIVISSIALLFRVLRQRRRVGQSLQWRKHWKMTVQLLFVAIIYLLFAFPVTLMNFLDLCGVPRHATADAKEYFLFFNYCMILLCPFACALSLPKLRDKIRNLCLSRQRARTVVPMPWALEQTVHHETTV